MKKRVTGMGGIFFKSEDPEKLNNWYREHLGLNITEWGCSFEWLELENKEAKVPAKTVWSIFKSDTKYFNPSEKPFMLNYRVENLEVLLDTLKSEGVTIAGGIEEYPYGKFAWIMDPDGNKIELWEPKDEGF